MKWYFNNQGMADGPHDEKHMRALVNEGLITTQTLIWHPELEQWEPVQTISPTWWQHIPVQVQSAPLASSVSEKPQDAIQRRASHHPASATNSPQQRMTGLIKKIFRRGSTG